VAEGVLVVLDGGALEEEALESGKVRKGEV
jgi:hypothetical protein